MGKKANSKIENIAINALETIIDDSDVMSYKFNSLDKEMAWDGYIFIHKDKNIESKASFDDKIPVQIKGHCDSKKIDKKRVQYSVNLDDLEIYYNDRGVIYFQILLSDDGKRKEVFYTSLYPSRIKKFLSKAKQKGNKGKLNITFTKMDKNDKSLYIIAKQFSKESRYQGFGCGPIVQNSISIQNLYQVKSITATAIGTESKIEFLERIKTGDVCIYGKTNELDLNLPIEVEDGTKYSICEEINNEVILDNVKYYSSYKTMYDSDGNQKLIFSKNLQINITTKEITFQPITTIQEIRKDSEFVINFLKQNNCNIEKTSCRSSNDMIKELEFFIELDDILESIELKYDKDFTYIRQHSIDSFMLLVKLKKGMFNDQCANDSYSYNWILEGKYVPLLVVKHENDCENDLINATCSERFSAYITDKNGKQYYVPMMELLDVNIFKNLYYYDIKLIKKQIENEDVNNFTCEVLNKVALLLILAYDHNKKIELLDLAQFQMKKICELDNSNPYFIINKLQIRKRYGELTAEEVDELKSIKSNDIQVLAGKCILLNDFKKAKKYVNDMDENIKSNFLNFPIYSLLTENNN